MKDKHIKQRDYMRQLFQKFNKDSSKIINAYAAGEKAGIVERKNNSHNLTSYEYAKKLFSEGSRRGWIKK